MTGGAEADVFASADDNNMKTVTDAGLIEGTPVDFVSNTLQIAVKPGNPLGITGLADVVEPDVQLVLCEDKVPCGAAAQKAFTAAGLTLNPVSKEQNVGAVLDKVKTGGEADAGSGLPHRHQGGRGRRRRRHRLPGGRRRGQRLPDRCAEGFGEPGGRGRVRRLRDVARRSGGARGLRLRATAGRLTGDRA